MKKPDAYIRALAAMNKALANGEQGLADSVADHMGEILHACSRSELIEILNKIMEKA